MGGTNPKIAVYATVAVMAALLLATLSACGAVQRFTQPRRPQTNGKVERFNRTLLEEWAYVRPYTSNQRRTRALTTWLHIYNHHRAHTALAGLPPIARVNNLYGNYT